MKRAWHWLVALSVCLLLASARAADAPDAAALIATVALKQGSIPDIVTAYGTAGPALESGEALSLPQDGQIAAIAVTPGERVRSGQNLLTFDLAANAVSAYAQAVAGHELAVAQRVHTAQLLSQRLATRDQLGQAEAAVANARATLDALKRQGADRKRTEIAAPFDGIVEAIPVVQGERVAAGTALLRLIRLGAAPGPAGLVVTVGVPPDDAPRVQPGQRAGLRRFGSDTVLPSQVLRIDAMVDPRSRLVDVDIGAPPALLAGEAFAATITVGRIAGWLVPHGAVLTDEKGDYLFQSDGSHAHRIDLHVLGTDGQTDVVAGRLDPSRPVVTDGATQLADGDPVRTAP